MENVDLILKTIQENPGIYTREIMRKTKLSNGVIQYHLRKLEKMSRIRGDKRPRYKRYYSVDVAQEEFPIIANLRKKTKQNLLFAILSSDDPCFEDVIKKIRKSCLLYTSPSPRDGLLSRMPSSA